MTPSKNILSNLKAETYINAIRLFCDACTLFEGRSYASAYAFAILSFEELGKLEMVDHICDDISINPDCKPEEFLNHLFSRTMFFNHKNKQLWASDLILNLRTKRVKEISVGLLDRAKQDALYVGYCRRRIRSPQRIAARKAYSEITLVLHKLQDTGDLGFNGFDCLSDVQSRGKAKRWLSKAEIVYMKVKKPRRKPNNKKS